MRNILILLLLIVTTFVFAQELKKAPIKNLVKVEPLKKGLTKLKVVPTKDANGEIEKKEVNKLTDKKAALVAVNNADGEVEKKEGTETEEVVEEVKFESKTFVLEKNAKIVEKKGFYYIKNGLALPQNLTVKDVPDDGGGVLEITWTYHTKNKPELFELLRKSAKETKFQKIKDFDTSNVKYSFTDKNNKEWETYQYQIQVNGKVLEINGNPILPEPTLNKRKKMDVNWKYPAKKLPKEFTIARRIIKKDKKTEYKKIGTLKSEKNVIYSFRNNSLNNDITYSYKVRVKRDGLYSDSKVEEGQSKIAWFDTNKKVMLISGIFLVFAIMFFIRMARSGKELYIRRIAGLDAVDDAVGRATEMGREIMFVPGITDIDDPQTIAGLTILGRVAKLTAQYKTPLSVPVSKSMVMVTGREIVKESYLSAGRPENFQDGMIYYLTDDQFGFAAGVDGIMVREKPATIFLQGAFYAESLILAETGHHIGAIQISGTAAPSQLPFFITACDYTLMGEELYAASAYLSREPQLLGSLRGQDAGKALILLAIVAGIILESFYHTLLHFQH